MQLALHPDQLVSVFDYDPKKQSTIDNGVVEGWTFRPDDVLPSDDDENDHNDENNTDDDDEPITSSNPQIQSLLINPGFITHQKRVIGHFRDKFEKAKQEYEASKSGTTLPKPDLKGTESEHGDGSGKPGSGRRYGDRKIGRDPYSEMCIMFNCLAYNQSSLDMILHRQNGMGSMARQDKVRKGFTQRPHMGFSSQQRKVCLCKAHRAQDMMTLKTDKVARMVRAALSPWSPLNHQIFPATFRKAVRQVLLCGQRLLNAPVPAVSQDDADSRNGQRKMPPDQSQSAVAVPRIPKDAWLHILSFCNRDEHFRAQ